MIYLDHSATTPLCEGARQAMAEAMACFGNPSSLHAEGLRAQKLLEQARRQVMQGLGGHAERQGELFFTSCGTEATSLALFGTAYAKKRREACRIITTDSEHPSVSQALARLSEDGFEIVRIPTRGGALDMAALNAALDKPVLLASMMMVNNETGARYDVEEAFRRIKAKYPEAVTHCDAVQGFLKTPFTPMTLGADLITLSGHKVHAPKGVGALYVSKKILTAKRLVPFLVGGGQERGMRSGTENVIGIAGFGGAVAELSPRIKEELAAMESLRSEAERRVRDMGIAVNTPVCHAPHILHITLPHIKSETMLHFLSSEGLCVSSGSACSSHASHPSDALLSFGLSAHEADCSLRISLGRENTPSDIDALCRGLQAGLDRLVRIKH